MFVRPNPFAQMKHDATLALNDATIIATLCLFEDLLKCCYLMQFSFSEAGTIDYIRL